MYLQSAPLVEMLLIKQLTFVFLSRILGRKGTDPRPASVTADRQLPYSSSQFVGFNRHLISPMSIEITTNLILRRRVSSAS